MVIRFESKAGGFIMLDEHALPLIRMTGHGGTVPGAIAAADVPRALAALRAAIAAAPAPAPMAAGGREDEPAAPPVSLRQRAFALTDLLERAARKGCDVQWAEEAGGVLRP